MGAPDSLARWAETLLLILAGCGLAATCLLWAEDTGLIATACRTLRTAAARAARAIPAALGRRWLTLCCRAAEARLYLTTLIGAHR